MMINVEKSLHNVGIEVKENGLYKTWDRVIAELSSKMKKVLNL